MTFTEHLRMEAFKLCGTWREIPGYVFRVLVIVHFPTKQVFQQQPFKEISWECRCGAKS